MKDWKKEYLELEKKLCFLLGKLKEGESLEWIVDAYPLGEKIEEWWSGCQSKWIALEAWNKLSISKQEAIKYHINELTVDED